MQKKKKKKKKKVKTKVVKHYDLMNVRLEIIIIINNYKIFN